MQCTACSGEVVAAHCVGSSSISYTISGIRCSIVDCNECCHVFVWDTIRCDNILEHKQPFVVDGWSDIQQWRSDSSIGWRLLHLHANIL